MSEKEFLRKKEMQDRVFLQWVTRKNEEEKVPLLPVYSPCHYMSPQARREAIKQQEQLRLEHQRQKIMMGKAAYSQWIKLQKEKDKLLLKQRQRENGEHVIMMAFKMNRTVVTEQAWLDHQQRIENQKKVQEAYENWKAQKDLEQQLAQQTNNDLLEPTAKSIYSLYSYSITDEVTLSYAASTPTVPGYCSVWICDSEMRKHVCTAVPRQPT